MYRITENDILPTTCLLHDSLPTSRECLNMAARKYPQTSVYGDFQLSYNPPHLFTSPLSPSLCLVVHLLSFMFAFLFLSILIYLFLHFFVTSSSIHFLTQSPALCLRLSHQKVYLPSCQPHQLCCICLAAQRLFITT